MKLRVLFLIGLFCLAMFSVWGDSPTSDSTGTDEWRTFGRYLNGTSYTTSYAPPNISDGPVVTYTMGDDSWMGGVVQNGTMYFANTDDRMYRLNSTNVSQLIQQGNSVGSFFTNPAIADNGFIYAGVDGTPFFQINASNVSQSIATKSIPNWVRTSPVVNDGFVYVGTHNDDFVYQLNASNVTHTLHTYQVNSRCGKGIAVANGFAYFVCSYSIFQLNASNISQKIAQYTTGLTVDSAPAVTKDYVYFGSDDNKVYQVNASNVSQVIATFTTGDDVEGSPAVAHGYVYIGSDDDIFYQLNASNISQQIANFTTGGNIPARAAVNDKYVFIGSYDKSIYQLDAYNVSKMIANYTLGNIVYGAVIIADGLVSVTALDSKVYQFGGEDPYVTLNEPLENAAEATSPASVDFNCSVGDRTELANVSLYITDSSNSSFVRNQTSPINGTDNSTKWTLNLINGTYTWNCLGQDSEGRINWALNRTFFVDDSVPNVTVESPLDSFFNDTSDPVEVDFNCSATDNAGLRNLSLYITDKSNTSFVANQTTSLSGAAAAANWTLNLVNGNYTWNCLVSDIAGNMNWSNNRTVKVNFSDITAPAFTDINNITVELKSPLVNDINATDAVGVSCFGLNDTANFKINCSGYLENNTILEQQLYWLNVSVNDSSLNNNSKIIWVNVTDSTLPAITILFPSNGTNTTNIGIDVNYSVFDLNIDSCWYTNDSMTTNVTLVNCANLTSITWSETNHNITIWANDTVGNVNSSSVSFNVDLTGPTFTVFANQTVGQTSAFSYDINANDSSGISCYAVNDSNFQIGCTGLLQNNSVLAAGDYVLNITVNDTLNQETHGLLLVEVSTVSTLSLTLDTPIGDINITQNSTFTVKVTVTCNQVDCGEVNVSLDPIPIVDVGDGGEGKEEELSTQSTINLLDNKSFTYDIQDGCDINDGQADVFDGGLRLYINNSEYTGTRSTTEDEGREAYCDPQTKSAMNVTRKVFVPLTEGWARYLEVLHNPTANRVCVDVKMSQNMGSDGSDFMNTSDHNKSWEVEDHWMMWDDLTVAGGDDAAGFIYQQDDATETIDTVSPVKASGGVNHWIWEDVCVPAGGTSILMHFFTQWNSRAEAENESTIIYNNFNADTHTSGMSDDEKSQVVNWALAAGKTGLVSTTVGDTPFFTTSTNPNNISLNAGESATISFVVNATGTLHQAYEFFVYANKTSDSSVSNITAIWNVTITNIADTTAPMLSLVSPANGTNSTNAGLDVNYTVNDVSLASCWYSNDSMTTNTTILNCANLTTITWSEGQHNVTIWANDTSGNENSTSVSFTIDAIAPLLNIINPNNNTNSSDNGLDVNYIVSDTGLASCWYSNDSMSTNTTLVNCANLTTITWNEGQHNVTIWANDTSGNENSTSVSFTIDTITPSLSIIFPSNNTNSTRLGLDINYTVNDVSLASCWYSNDSMSTNTTIADCGNVTTINWSEGQHNVTIWANDSAGNENSSTVSFTTDITGPDITIISPFNNSGFRGGNVTFRYNITDVSAVVNCSLIVNDKLNLTNTSLEVTQTQNFTIFNAPKGQYNWSLNCTDFLNHSSIKNRVVYVIPAGNFLGRSTDLGRVNVSNVSHFVIDQPNFGLINFTQNLDLTNGTDINTYVNISFNRIELNATVLRHLNKSAKLALYNLTFTTPRLLRNDEICPSDICAQINYSGGTLEFNVTQFSTYSSEETPVPVGEESSSSSGGGGASGGGGGGGDLYKDKEPEVIGRLSDREVECTTNDECSSDKTCYYNQCVKLFDVKIIEVDSPVGDDGMLGFTYFIKGVANISGDVIINFWLEQDEEIVSSGQDTIYLGSFEEKTEETKIFVPKNLATGSYDFHVRVTFENYQARAHRTVFVEQGEVKIVEDIQKPSGFNVYLFIMIILLILLILLATLYYWKQEESKVKIKAIIAKFKRRGEPEVDIRIDDDLLIESCAQGDDVKSKKLEIKPKRRKKIATKKSKKIHKTKKTKKTKAITKKKVDIKKVHTKKGKAYVKKKISKNRKKETGNLLTKGLLKAVLRKKVKPKSLGNPLTKGLLKAILSKKR
jgi:hypothetical protein